MGAWLKLAAGGLGLVASGLMGLIGYVWTVDPRFDVPLPSVTASRDPAVVARGEYLVYAVAHCSDCHGARPAGDHTPNAGRPPLTGGQPIVTPFGTFPPPNITPEAVGDWTDAELARVIRHGVRRDGSLSAFMKVAIGPMSDEDLTAIVSYLRTVPAATAPQTPSQPNLLGQALFAFGMFQPAFKPIPDHAPPAEEPSAARGAYLARGPANCVGCHTESDPAADMAFIAPELSGGGPHPSADDPSMVYVPPNLTPAGPLADWTEDQFVARFRQGRSYPDTLMPWENYGQLTESDLRSIWRFLLTVPPVERDTGPSLQPG